MITNYQGLNTFKINLESDNFYTRVQRSNTKYLLFEYETYLRKLAKEPLDLKLDDILSEKFEIEHVWANDSSKLKLTEEDSKVHEQIKDKLGNLTLASGSWNSKWQNKPFSDKKVEYGDSNLRVQRELAKKPDWNKKQIERREKKLTKFASKRWKIKTKHSCASKGCDGELTDLSPGGSGDCPICKNKIYSCPYEGCPGTLEKNKNICPLCKRGITWN